MNVSVAMFTGRYNQQPAYPASGGVNVNEANATSFSDVPSKPATVTVHWTATSALDSPLRTMQPNQKSVSPKEV